ncbi:hypothetical protein M9H77_08158 [Catharanthus roseus]|uniref:Uncharacterized protein n=1 Tax=Catharanthus roseus TaxID=4058 RepID=A0ACC0BXA2_CATRO|nr:hypothetical protein M9H77_08158 [Catharanthus roseus]
MTKIWGRPDSKPHPRINFFENVLPIGDKKTNFVEFLGIIARNGKYAPTDITYYIHYLYLFVKCFFYERELNNPPSPAKKFKKCYTHKMTAMDECASQLLCNSQYPVAPNDSFAQVMGDERNDRVKMMGLGVTPNDLWENVPSKKILYRVFQEQQTMLEKLVERYQSKKNDFKIKRREWRICYL